MEELMPEVIEGFSQFEYLLIFNAIVFGAIASEYFSGWGVMLRNRRNIQFSLLQLLWTVFAFMLMIHNWYGNWPRAKYIDDSLYFFYFSIVPMLIFYLISVVLFPGIDSHKKVDFKEHYESNARILFILFGIYLVFTIVGSYIYLDIDKGDILSQNILRSLGILLCIFSAIFHRKMWLHYLFLTLNFIGLAIFINRIPH